MLANAICLGHKYSQNVKFCTYIYKFLDSTNLSINFLEGSTCRPNAYYSTKLITPNCGICWYLSTTVFATLLNLSWSMFSKHYLIILIPDSASQSLENRFHQKPCHITPKHVSVSVSSYITCQYLFNSFMTEAVTI